jgi:hypothetical protein
MLYMPLSILDGMAGIELVPMPVKVLSHDPELDDEVAGGVLGLDFAALLSPEAEQRVFVIAHYDAGIRPADKGPAISRIPRFRLVIRHCVLRCLT